MKSLKLNRGPLPGSVLLPGSKSYANRALILGALRSGPLTIENFPKAIDVVSLKEALRNIGLCIDENRTSVTIQNYFPECEKEGTEVFVGEGGTTARFLAAMLLTGGAPYTLVLGERLKERPWEEFISFVLRFGAHAELNGNKLHLKGPLKLPSMVQLDCKRTTQFASAIQLAFNATTKVEPLNMNSSQSYWEMSEKLIDEIKNAGVYRVPLDWSSAGYPMAFAALNHKIHFPGLVFDPYQADAKFLELLKDFGAIEERDEGLMVRPVVCHRAVQMEVSDCLDLVPALSYFLAHIEGIHELKGIGNLIYKESDRLQEVKKLLQTFERESDVKGDVLVIYGSKVLCTSAKDLQLPDDHRMVMTGALFLRHHSGGTIAPVDAVDKSFPGFFGLFK